MSDTGLDEDKSDAENVVNVVTQILLFFLVLGFAATVDYKGFKSNIVSKGVVICLLLQFIVMPFIGYILILLINDLEDVVIVTVMIILSSPGGTYSNFYSSLFNGDLSLSVAMTTVSTFLSIITLPLNLLFYVGFLLASRNNEDVGELIDWGILAQTVAIIISAICVGLFLNYKFPKFANYFNAFANLCGLALIVISLTISNSDKPLWEQPFNVVLISFLPSLIAIVMTTLICFKAGIEKPKIFVIAIEVCLQNSAIAFSFSFAAFSGTKLQNALAVPVLYGFANFVYASMFAFYGLYRGWTYTPSDVSLYRALLFNHQPKPETLVEETQPPTVLGSATHPTMLTL